MSTSSESAAAAEAPDPYHLPAETPPDAPDREETPVATRVRITRDAAIITVALGLLVFEVTIGGARPSALTAITSLLLSPLVLRIDEARKNRNGKP